MLSKVEVAHLIVYSQVVSPCSKFLAATTNFGFIGIFNISKVLSSCNAKSRDSEVLVNAPLLVWLAHSDGGSYSLVSSDDFLISGGLGEIVGWRWQDVTSLGTPKVAWKLNVPKLDALNITEVNSMYVDSINSTLYAACGDSKIHGFDLSSGTLLSSFTGHKKYVHSVAPAGPHELVSGSEDGTVRVWDSRSSSTNKAAVQCLNPAGESDLARPRHGKWITTAQCDVDNWDWLVCGGGPKLAVWHMRALKHTTVFEPDVSAGDWTAQSAIFLDDRIVAGGSQNRIFHWHVNGQLQAAVPTSSSHVMQVLSAKSAPGGGSSREDKHVDLVFACGSRKRIDVFGGLGYSKATLQF